MSQCDKWCDEAWACLFSLQKTSSLIFFVTVWVIVKLLHLLHLKCEQHQQWPSALLCSAKLQLCVSCSLCTNIAIFHPASQWVIQECNLVISVSSPDVPSMLSLTAAEPQKCCGGAQTKHRDILQNASWAANESVCFWFMMENREHWRRWGWSREGGLCGLHHWCSECS